MMDGVVEPFTQLVKSVPLQKPQIRFVSNLTGRWITDEEATDPTYWARHLREAVRFADGVGELLRAEPDCVLLEVGPGTDARAAGASTSGGAERQRGRRDFHVAGGRSDERGSC